MGPHLGGSGKDPLEVKAHKDAGAPVISKHMSVISPMSHTGGMLPQQGWEKDLGLLGLSPVLCPLGRPASTRG